MTYAVDWAAKRVTIPKADLTLLQASPEVRELDMSAFWLAIRALEDDESAQGFPRIVDNTAPKTVAGLTLGRVVEVVNGYEVEFENGQYSVNVVGANNNVADVKVQNMVSVNTANSAGLQTVVSGSGVTNQDKLDIADQVRIELSPELAEILNAKFILQRKRILDPATGLFTIYAEDGVTPLFTAQTYKDVAGTQPYDGTGRIHRTEELG